MAPTAIVLAPEPTHENTQKVIEVVDTLGSRTTTGSTLVIGSQSTAQDGKYQSIIMNSSNEANGLQNVEKQMLDRILDEGAEFSFY
jgi:hypothetical protein